jgi:hypothetical protein
MEPVRNVTKILLHCGNRLSEFQDSKTHAYRPPAQPRGQKRRARVRANCPPAVRAVGEKIVRCFNSLSRDRGTSPAVGPAKTDFAIADRARKPLILGRFCVQTSLDRPSPRKCKEPQGHHHTSLRTALAGTIFLGDVSATSGNLIAFFSQRTP